MEITILMWVLAAVLVVAGFLGLFLPVLPGTPLIFAGLLLAAWIEDFHHVGAGTLVFLALLAALAYLIDFVAGLLGAKRFGASTRALWGAAIGAVVGLAFGIAGVLLGPLVGAVIGEWTVRGDVRAAGRAGFGTTLGLVLGAAAKIALAFTMLGVFLLARML